MKNPTRSIKNIYEMLDLFYANKHMYDRLKKQEERKKERKKKGK